MNEYLAPIQVWNIILRQPTNSIKFHFRLLMCCIIRIVLRHTLPVM